jgi:hypothetical protein
MQTRLSYLPAMMTAFCERQYIFQLQQTLAICRVGWVLEKFRPW